MTEDHVGSNQPEIRNALHRLGFGTTEAKVLVGLHRLGAATAREVSRVTEVARPQVYSAVEGLEQRGLINVQQANPKQFQPVSPDETAANLRRSFEADIEVVEGQLEAVAAERDRPEEERDDIWTLRGREAISERIVRLIKDATSRVVIGVTDEALLPSEVEQALYERAGRGVDVLVMSPSAAVRNRFADDEDVGVFEPDEHMGDHGNVGRVLLIDDDTVLHSMLGEEELPGIRRETAFWSSGTGFASTFIAMMDYIIDDHRSVNH